MNGRASAMHWTQAAPAPKMRPFERLPLVGRQREWQTLQTAWQAAMQGQTHFVCLWVKWALAKRAW